MSISCADTFIFAMAVVGCLAPALAPKLLPAGFLGYAALRIAFTIIEEIEVENDGDT